MLRDKGQLDIRLVGLLVLRGVFVNDRGQYSEWLLDPVGIMGQGLGLLLCQLVRISEILFLVRHLSFLLLLLVGGPLSIVLVYADRHKCVSLNAALVSRVRQLLL